MADSPYERIRTAVHVLCCVTVSTATATADGTCGLLSCKWSQLGAQFFLVCLFIFCTCFGRLCTIIRRNNCICMALGTCHSVWMTSGMQVKPCIPDSHPFGFIYKIIQRWTVNKTLTNVACCPQRSCCTVNVVVFDGCLIINYGLVGFEWTAIAQSGWTVRGSNPSGGRSGVPWNFFRGEGGSTNSVENKGQRGRGSWGGSPLVSGSGGSCNLVQEISFHIVKFSQFLVL